MFHISFHCLEDLWRFVIDLYNIFEGIAKYMKNLGHFSVVLELAIKYVSKVSDTHPWKSPQKGGQIAAAYLEHSRTSWMELFLPKKVNKPAILLGSKYAPELNHSIKLLAVLPKSTDKNVRVALNIVQQTKIQGLKNSKILDKSQICRESKIPRAHSP